MQTCTPLNQTRNYQMTFGKSMLKEWPLAPDIVYLNHGTVGATPNRVLQAQDAIRKEIERQPSQFILRELTGALPMGERTIPRLREAMARVAPFLGARPDDMVFVDNATTGVNAVVQSLRLNPGDEILVTDLTYGSVGFTAQAVATGQNAASLVVDLPYPANDPAQIVQSFTQRITKRTRLAVIDHVTSESSIVMPIKEIIAACHERDVLVLVDAAHAPGMLKVDIPSYGADFYTGNLHKWAFAPRGCAILWCSKEHQDSVHYPIISWGRNKGFIREFEWIATKDPSPFLSAPTALDFIDELGFERMQAYNHSLAWQSALYLADGWSTDFRMHESTVGSMVTVPLPTSLGKTRDDASRLRADLLYRDKIEIQLHPWREQLWVRVSTQIYNDMSDIERLVEAILSYCR